MRGISISSIISTSLVKSTRGKIALHVITRGFYIAAALSAGLFALFTVLYMRDPNINGGNIIWRPLASVVIGVVLAIIIDKVTAHFTVRS